MSSDEQHTQSAHNEYEACRYAANHAQLERQWQALDSYVTELGKDFQLQHCNWEELWGRAQSAGIVTVCDDIHWVMNNVGGVDTSATASNDQTTLSVELLTARQQLQAWQEISTWLVGRMSENHALLKQLYAFREEPSTRWLGQLFYFELLISHRQLHPACRQLVQEPATEVLASPGWPWLVAPHNYAEELRSVALRKEQIAQRARRRRRKRAASHASRQETPAHHELRSPEVSPAA